MQASQGVSFGPYHLAGPQGPLVLKSQTVNLPPKALAILWVLVAYAGQVVSKAELFATIWPDTVVGEETLTSFIRLLRRALKDDSRQPRYVATVHRVGYRFLPAVATQPGLRSQVPGLLCPPRRTSIGKSLSLHNLEPGT